MHDPIQQLLSKLTRNNARDQVKNFQLSCTAVSRATDANLQLNISWQNHSITLMVNEVQWCAWIGEQLATPTLAEIEPDLIQLLANWSLLEVNQHLKKNQSTEVSVISISIEPGVKRANWALTVHRNDQELQLYLTSSTPEFESALFDSLKRDENNSLSFPLDFGWLQVTPGQWEHLNVGDALRVYGSNSQASIFNARLPNMLLQLELIDGTHARVIGFINEATDDLSSATIESHRINFDSHKYGDLQNTLNETTPSNDSNAFKDNKFRAEAGRICIMATNLVGCSVGSELLISIVRESVPIITYQGTKFASGKLLTFVNDWMLLIEDKFH
jgi:hypothetical protein